ncbi:ribonuclease J [Candidatus Falkowbacteria bacterium]|nr:ribonuclease J [Candidatus Falkowbacteria bacterium]
MITKYKSSSSAAASGSPRTRGRFARPEAAATPRTETPRVRSASSQTLNDMPHKRGNVRERTFANGKLRVMVMGGLEEVGRNMTMFEYDKEIIIIDMGLQFPEEDMPGIDYIIPNITYLEDKKDWIKGVIITHGHMDHIGAIPHLVPSLNNPPMFMGKLTAGLVKKLAEKYHRQIHLDIAEVNESTKLQLGRNFQVEFFRVNHSIPDGFAVIVRTPVGTVIHTGDFKIDYTPVNDQPADINRIALLGATGVLMLMSDSTDSTHPGYQVSESYIGDEMNKLFDKIDGRIIIGTFASQISRVQKILELAEKHGRKVSLQGRTMNDNVEVAHQIGYLKFNPSILVEDKDLGRYPDNKLIILGTGAQGESSAFLSRVVNKEHRTIELKKGDTVIFSSSVIPGNERTIQNLKDMVVRQGAKVIHYQMMDVHAGGHAKQEDLKLMMRLIKPEYFMPIEGNHYLLQAHADLARGVGIAEEKIYVADNGQVVEFTKGADGKTHGQLTKEKVPADYVMVDGLGVGDVSNIVLRDRRVMAEDGMIVIITTIDNATGEPIGNPDIISRGFVYMKEHKELIEKTRMKVKKIVKEHDPRIPADDDYIKNKIRNDIGQFLFSQTKRRPMVLPVVIKV